jgi:hypothetical protein
LTYHRIVDLLIFVADPLGRLWYFELKYALLLAYHACVVEFWKLSVKLHDLLFGLLDFSQVFVLE